MAKTRINQSGEKILDVLNVLLRHFAYGLTSTDLVKATGLSACNITGYVNTLESKGSAIYIGCVTKSSGRPATSLVADRSI